MPASTMRRNARTLSRTCAPTENAPSDPDAQVGQAVDVADDLVALDHRPDVFRCAGVDDVAGGEFECLREVADLLRHRPDHLVEIGVLLDVAVDLEPDRALSEVAGA